MRLCMFNNYNGFCQDSDQAFVKILCIFYPVFRYTDNSEILLELCKNFDFFKNKWIGTCMTINISLNNLSLDASA